MICRYGMFAVSFQDINSKDMSCTPYTIISLYEGAELFIILFVNTDAPF